MLILIHIMLIHPHPHSYSCPPLYWYSHIPIHHYHHRKELRKHWSINAMAGTVDYPHHPHPHPPHHQDHKVAAVVYQRRARASDREPKSRERRPASLLCCNHLYIVHTCIGRTIQVKEMNRNDASLCTCCKGQAYASTTTNKVTTRWEGPQSLSYHKYSLSKYGQMYMDSCVIEFVKANRHTWPEHNFQQK